MSANFWDRLWRSAGTQFVILLIVAYFLYGDHPLIATFIFGVAVLNLLWFAAAIRGVLRDAGQDGWGAAATAASAALGAVLFVLMSMDAALAYKIAGSGNNAAGSALNDVAWACFVISSFPRAMLIMAGTFGLWRAGMLSSALFGLGVAAVVLVLLGGTTWATDGVWAPDGVYSRFISPLIGIAWIVVMSAILLKSPSAARAPDRAVVAQW